MIEPLSSPPRIPRAMYATAVGLLMFGAEKEGVEQRFRIRDENVFNRILGRMRKWFVDVK